MGDYLYLQYRSRHEGKNTLQCIERVEQVHD